eukprot:GHVP01000321.1.p1 GENE.GHVP01000321.1~~GHVP01000321.1.p1  ORF type:complete len:104 (-),score=5.10 GHVP01000321.1:480-791(-)
MGGNKLSRPVRLRLSNAFSPSSFDRPTGKHTGLGLSICPISIFFTLDNLPSNECNFARYGEYPSFATTRPLDPPLALSTVPSDHYRHDVGPATTLMSRCLVSH